MSRQQHHQISRWFRWESAHRLVSGYQGKCSDLHGHSWRGLVQVSLRPAATLSDSGFVLDFARLKGVQQWIDDHWDHATIVDSRDEPLVRFLREQGQKHYVLEGRPPSSECLCEELLGVASRLLDDDRCYVSEVRVRETEANEARLTRSLGGDSSP